MGAAGLWRTIKHPRQRRLNGHQRGAGVAPPPRTPLPLPVRGGSCWDGGSGGESCYSLGDAGATWGRVGIRGMDVFCQDGGAQPPAGLLFDYPPAWNRALCRFIDAERRRFRGRSIRMELDLNGRLQAAVTTGLPLRVCTAPAATRVRVQLGGPGGSVMRSLQCTASIQGRPWLIRSYLEERVVLWFSVLEGSRVVGRRPRPERFAYRVAKGLWQDHGEVHLPI